MVLFTAVVNLSFHGTNSTITSDLSEASIELLNKRIVLARTPVGGTTRVVINGVSLTRSFNRFPCSVLTCCRGGVCSNAGLLVEVVTATVKATSNFTILKGCNAAFIMAIVASSTEAIAHLTMVETRVMDRKVGQGTRKATTAFITITRFSYGG